MAESEWTKEFPTADGIYWWRRGEVVLLGICRIDSGDVYIPGAVGPRYIPKDSQWLSASPADAEQLVELRRSYDAVVRDLKQAAFAYHVESNHKPAAFATCRNAICANACRVFNACVEANPKHLGEETQGK